MFGRLKPQRSFISVIDHADSIPESTGSITSGSGTVVDNSCNSTITVTCINELYNVTDFNASATNGNAIGLTGYLEQFANFQDLQDFYADQLPQAVGTNFSVELVNGSCNSFRFLRDNVRDLLLSGELSYTGGENDQTPANAGAEANLDTQFALGVSFPTPGLFWSTGGSPPFIRTSLLPKFRRLDLVTYWCRPPSRHWNSH